MTEAIDPHDPRGTGTARLPALWVDADACPGVIREIIVRAAERVGIATTFVANQWIRLPASKWVQARQVGGGFDAADDWIVEQVREGDFVVTQDIPLAARVVEKGCTAVGLRGERFDAATIGARLSMRNFMEDLRGAGVDTGGPPPLHPRDRAAFAAELDRWLLVRARRLAAVGAGGPKTG